VSCLLVVVVVVVVPVCMRVAFCWTEMLTCSVCLFYDFNEGNVSMHVVLVHVLSDSVYTGLAFC
jgi:hypothetical protein